MVYKEISEIVTKEVEENEEKESEPVVEIKENEYAALKGINEDYIFWIEIPGTDVNYPVVQSKDNEEYLSINFNGEYNSGGSIFVDCRNESIEDDNIIIHGHNMKDKSMFGTLSKMLDSDYLSENKIIKIHLENKILEYEVFSVYVNKGDFNSYVTNFASDEEFNTYINEVRKKSYYDFNYDDNGERNIITLSTCTNATGIERTIVHAKMKSVTDI